MPNRVMEVKWKKLRAQRRRHPRRMDLDRKGARPNKSIIGEYADRAKTLSESPDAEFLGLGHGTNGPAKAALIRNQQVILNKFDDPLFVDHINNYAQRVRIYFNSRQDKWIIQQIDWIHKIFRISCTYSNKEDAFYALTHEVVTWDIQKYFPNQTATPPVGS